MSKLYKQIAVTLLLASTSLLGSASASATSQSTSTLTESDLITFISENPAAYSEIEKLSMEITGEHYWVKLPWLNYEVTGDIAQELLDNEPVTKSPRASLPLDTFSISIGRASVTNGVYVTGSVVFKATYAGQSDPDDVASLQFSMPKCIVLTKHAITTHRQSGASTNLGYLYDAGLADDSPVWKIQDYVSGFENQAHKSAASVLLSKSGCTGTKTIQAAYRYEHNHAGSVTSVSASYGILSITYNNPGSVLQKSSSVMTFSF